MTRALVLSGGGSVGIAWQTGLALGLLEGGVDVSLADSIVGTSAGSAVGALLAQRRDLRESLDRFAPPPSQTLSGTEPTGTGSPAAEPTGRGASSPAAERPATRRSERADSGGMPELMQIIAKVIADGGGARDVRMAVGQHALSARTPSEDGFVNSFSHLDCERWPRTFACTAIDVETGEFRVWDADAKVALPRAVASSCAVPGLFPPILIDGRRYMDGGIRSATNADLAKGMERVLLISLVGGAMVGGGNPMRGEAARRPMERELRVLQESGSRVEMIHPDAGSAAAMGMDLMNPSHTYAAGQAGLHQGRAEAERIRSFWS